MALTKITTKQINTATLVNAVDDAAAALAGVAVGGLYHNGGILRVRLA